MESIDRDDFPASIRAEAAAWLARLRSDKVAPQDLAGFRAWLREDSRHERVFEKVTAAWEIAGGVVGDGDRRETPRRIRRRALVLGGTSAVVAAAGLGVYSLTASETFSTRTGEQRRVALADGSAVTLDTNTHLQVSLEQEQRFAKLVKGRAYFQVATDRRLPFVVRAGDRQVVALRAAFDVSQQRNETAILLVDGHVAVRPVQSAGSVLSLTLSPGERVVYQQAQLIVQDRPNLFKAAAWQTGRAVFDDEPLSQAIAEMNRYSRRPLIIADRALSDVRISGIYDVDDTEGFARSVSLLLSASVQITPDAIVLGRAARPSQTPA